MTSAPGAPFASTMLGRKVAPSPRPRPPFLRVIGRNLTVMRSTWALMLSGFFEPVFYLLSIGLGIGALIGTVTVDGRSVSYPAFVAPGLLAASAMNGAIYESTMNVFFRLKEANIYAGMLTTPLGPDDIALGEIAWSVLRATFYAGGFLVVMLAIGVIHSWWGLLLLPAAMLVGFAFSATGMAFTCYIRSWQDIQLVQLVVLILFLFSSTFYPLSTYDPALRNAVRITPLYRGVDLLRGLSVGSIGTATVFDVTYLLLMGGAGMVVARRRFPRLLVT